VSDLSILIGKRLREARESARLSQVEVQKTLKYSSTGTVSGHENGDSTPRAEDLAKLCKLYGVSIDWVTGRSDDPNFHWVSGRLNLSDEEKEIILLRRKAPQRDREIADGIYRGLR